MLRERIDGAPNMFEIPAEEPPSEYVYRYIKD